MRVLRLAAILGLFLVLLLSSCRDEPELEVLDEYESAGLAARAWSFQVFPGSEFLPDFTGAYRRSHALLNPESPEPPPIAVYVTDVPVEEVARFYAEKYGYPEVAELQAASESGPPAHYTSGDLGTDTRNISGLLTQLGYEHDLSSVGGTWQGAHIEGTGPYPRVTIQRPYFDFESGEIVDRTLILMVRE